MADGVSNGVHDLTLLANCPSSVAEKLVESGLGAVGHILLMG